MTTTLPDQASTFRQLRARLFRNGLRVALQNSRTRLVTMLGTSAFVFGFTFAVGMYLFNQLAKTNVPFKGGIVEGLFDLMFFTLGTMLVFSTGLILYASLFTSPEARYLLCSPARADRIFATKFQAAVAFSSWGFVVLGIPITAESQTGSSETMVRVPLNGTMLGRELRLTFHRDFGLRKASISSRWSDRERQLFNIAVDEY